MRAMTCAYMNGNGGLARDRAAFTSPAALPVDATWLHVVSIHGKTGTTRRLGGISP